MDRLTAINAKKLAIEKRLRAQLQGLYNDILQDVLSQIIDGSVYNFAVSETYKIRLREILKKHQEVIQELFVDGSMEKIKNLDIIYQDIINEVEQALTMRFDKETELIHNSTKDNINKWIVAVLLLLQDENIQSSPENISKAFNNLAKQKLKIKAISESITQTNWAVENTRRINSKIITANIVEQSEQAYNQKRVDDDAWKTSLATVGALCAFSPRLTAPKYSSDFYHALNADEFADAEESIKIFSQEKKRWITVGDGKVRDTHLEAEQQGAILVDEYFQVGAYLMLYPGDNSMGAGIDELANCRCDAEYI